MNSLPSEILKYLNKYSSPKYTVEQTAERYKTVVVIPAVSEYENIKVLLGSLSENDPSYFTSSLILFVINNTRSSPDEVKSDNAAALDFLRAVSAGLTHIEPGLSSKIISSGLKIGIVDASSPGNELTDKEGGVGLARKIGMDTALTLFDYSSAGKNIIICLDADCTVEKNYLSAVIDAFNKYDLQAAVINFNHMPEGENAEAIICYEIFLRYYVLGLRYAGSPYAFHTIGSSMACDYLSYIKAEGMNKRKAAEDFYFLQKLSKITGIGRINTTVVRPSSRRSWRVPFGTGQRVGRFMSGSQNEYLLYDPAVFDILKKWLNVFKEVNDAGIISHKAGEIHPELHKYLVERKFEETLRKILSNAKSENQISKQKVVWFDGFMTLKLIHHLRDTAFPQIDMFDALDIIFEKFGVKISGRIKSALPPVEIRMKYLESLRELDRDVFSG